MKHVPLHSQTAIVPHAYASHDKQLFSQSKGLARAKSPFVVTGKIEREYFCDRVEVAK